MARGKGLKRKKRQQDGYFHIILNANYQVNIFEDDDEVNKFLDLFDKYAPRYSAKMFGCSIMNTHIHMAIKANGISSLMMLWLKDFSTYRNKKHRTKGKLFISPFECKVIPNRSSLFNVLMYLYLNPYREGLCSHPGQYKWCSYRTHFPENATREFIDRKTRKDIIHFNINSEILRKHYPTEKEFENAFWEFVKKKEADSKSPGADGRMTDSPSLDMEDKYHPYSKKSHNSDMQIIEYRNMILAGRNLRDLPINEIDEIILRILKETFANRRQVASAMMVSYEHVRGVERKAGLTNRWI